MGGALALLLLLLCVLLYVIRRRRTWTREKKERHRSASPFLAERHSPVIQFLNESLGNHLGLPNPNIWSTRKGASVYDRPNLDVAGTSSSSASGTSTSTPGPHANVETGLRSAGTNSNPNMREVARRTGSHTTAGSDVIDIGPLVGAADAERSYLPPPPVPTENGCEIMPPPYEIVEGAGPVVQVAPSVEEASPLPASATSSSSTSQAQPPKSAR